jgi:hypothetical protein
MRAFWRSAPAVRFNNLVIFATGNLSFEYFRSSARSSFVQDFTRGLMFLVIMLSKLFNAGTKIVRD